MKTLLPLLALLALCCLALGQGEQKDNPKESPKEAPKVNPFLGGEEVVEKNMRKLLFEIRAVETQAISWLSDVELVKKQLLKRQSKSTLQAIRFLGEIRSTRGVDCLCELLLYPSGRTDGGARPWTEDFPAANALAQIGRAGTEGLLRKIGGSETAANYRTLAAKVLMFVHGRQDVIRAIDSFRKYDRSFAKEYRRRLDAFKKEIEPLLE